MDAVIISAGAAFVILLLVMGGGAAVVAAQGGIGPHPFGRTPREKRREVFQLVWMALGIFIGAFMLSLVVTALVGVGMDGRRQRIEHDAEAARRGWDRGGR